MFYDSSFKTHHFKGKVNSRLIFILDWVCTNRIRHLLHPRRTHCQPVNRLCFHELTNQVPILFQQLLWRIGLRSQIVLARETLCRITLYSWLFLDPADLKLIHPLDQLVANLMALQGVLQRITHSLTHDQSIQHYLDLNREDDLLQQKLNHLNQRVHPRNSSQALLLAPQTHLQTLQSRCRTEIEVRSQSQIPHLLHPVLLDSGNATLRPLDRDPHHLIGILHIPKVVNTIPHVTGDS